MSQKKNLLRENSRLSKRKQEIDKYIENLLKKNPKHHKEQVNNQNQNIQNINTQQFLYKKKFSSFSGKSLQSKSLQSKNIKNQNKDRQISKPKENFNFTQKINIKNLLELKQKLIQKQKIISSKNQTAKKCKTIVLKGQQLQISSLRQQRNYIIQVNKIYNQHYKSLPNYQKTIVSLRHHKNIKAFSASTNRGIHKNYNQDRISIHLQMKKTQLQNNQICFFGLYDGHAGSGCAQFLQKQQMLFINTPQAIYHALNKAQLGIFSLIDFLQYAKINNDKSGSCALILLLINKNIFIANVGDSRAVLSFQLGNKFQQITRDHKPVDRYQQTRILKAGGQIIVTQYQGQQISYGPLRISPGRLSVSRAFGDIDIKSKKGQQKVLISEPNIFRINLQENKDLDYVILGSDGIFDKIDNGQAIKVIWKGLNINKYQQLNIRCKIATQELLKTAINKKSLDNISVILVMIKELKQNKYLR